jgi:hypothetical protein
MNNRTPYVVIAFVSLLMVTILYAGGMFVISGFLPPPSPSMTEAEVVRMYAENRNSIITGLTMAFVGCGFMLPPCIIGSVFMSEVEEGFPYFAFLQGLSALATVLFTAFPNFIWMTAAFRVERAPELITLLHDLGWIMWATPSWGFAFQLLCLAVVALKDKRPEPFLPRWMAYIAIWLALGMTATPLVPFFTEPGPFAWNGLFSFWIAFFAPVTWIAVLCLLIIFNLMKGKGNEANEAPSF